MPAGERERLIGGFGRFCRRCPAHPAGRLRTSGAAAGRAVRIARQDIRVSCFCLWTFKIEKRAAHPHFAKLTSMATKAGSGWGTPLKPRAAVIEILESRIAPANLHRHVFNDGGGDGTLRKAIQDANAISGTDAIEFKTGGTIKLTSHLPDITEDVTLIAGRLVTLDGKSWHQSSRLRVTTWM